MKWIVFLLYFIPNIGYTTVDDMINDIETASGCEMAISSGFRSPIQNKRVGGSKSSYHLVDRARDIYPKVHNCVSLFDIWRLGCMLGSSILYKSHVHLDDRVSPVCFKDLR
jgi:hypothetical protein